MWLVKKEMEDRRTQCWRAAEARPEKGLQMGPATQRGGHQEMGTPLSGVQYSSFINCCQWWDYESASSGTVLNFTFLILIAFLKGCTSLYSEWVKMLVFSLSPVVANLLLLSHSVVSDSVTPWTIARQPPLSTGILQARILDWVAISSRGSSWPRNQTQVSSIAGGFFTVWATREAPL